MGLTNISLSVTTEKMNVTTMAVKQAIWFAFPADGPISNMSDPVGI